MTDSLPMPITALTSAQRAQILNLVRRAAKAEILPRFRRLSGHQVGTKSAADDLVTEADKGAEAMMTRALQAMFPHALIVGEENASENPAIMDKIVDAELCFTIDPVDGTWNYAKGLPLFGVMVSVLRFGVPVFGLLYDPIVNDVIWAETNGPALLQMPRQIKRAVHTSSAGPLSEMMGYVPLALIPSEKRGQMAATYPNFLRITSLRCACHEARMVAQGHADFVLFAKLTPWDQPAGVLVMRQAGGHVEMLDGSEYRGDLRSGYLLAAANKDTWERVRDQFAFLVEEEAAPADATPSAA